MSKSETASAEMDSRGPRLVAPELVAHQDGGLRLVGGACRICNALSFPKAQVCAECLSLDIVDRMLSCEGELYSFSRVHMAPKGWDVPYIIGYVDLPEGVRVLAHIDDANGAPRIGEKVRLGEGRVGADALGVELRSYVFTPIDGARS